MWWWSCSCFSTASSRFLIAWYDNIKTIADPQQLHPFSLSLCFFSPSLSFPALLIMSYISIFQGERIRIWSVREGERERKRERERERVLVCILFCTTVDGFSIVRFLRLRGFYIFSSVFFFPIWFDTFLVIRAWIGSFSLLGSFLVFASIASLNALPSAVLWPTLFCGDPWGVSLDLEFIVTVLVPTETQKRPSCEVPENGRWKVSDSRPSFLPFLPVIRHRR